MCVCVCQQCGESTFGYVPHFPDLKLEPGTSAEELGKNGKSGTFEKNNKRETVRFAVGDIRNEFL